VRENAFGQASLQVEFDLFYENLVMASLPSGGRWPKMPSNGHDMGFEELVK
jgi:hypothetical protein